jgi:hypothetical protein
MGHDIVRLRRSDRGSLGLALGTRQHLSDDELPRGLPRVATSKG